MDKSLYDEFSNYIGLELDSDEEDSEQENEDEERGLDDGHDDRYLENGMDDDRNDARETEVAVVLAEDKKYYPSAMEVYGEGVETLVMDEDAQPLEEPIIMPINLKKFEVVAKEVLTYVPTDFLLGLMVNPTLIRNGALIVYLHHGKTLIMDMLFQQTQDVNTLDPSNEKHLRYTDTRIDEQERQISIKTVPMSLVLEESAGKSYLCNIMGTPGHVNFSDEITAALRLTDGAVLVVDAVEGVMVNTERSIRHAMQERIPIVMVINKVDRLITELKLPPTDAYHKLRHTLEETNNIVASYSTGVDGVPIFDPVFGNLCFASATAGWSFTLLSSAKLYVKLHGIPFDPAKFASKLWGDTYYHPDTRTFKKKPPSGGGERAFVQFVLEPLYKIYSQVIGDHRKNVKNTLAELGVTLSNAA